LSLVRLFDAATLSEASHNPPARNGLSDSFGAQQGINHIVL
jgi:hypothetical protein